jgi:hypothetical protein
VSERRRENERGRVATGGVNIESDKCRDVLKNVRQVAYEVARW